MNVNLSEEEITYEQVEDYQGSTYPEQNYFVKKQTTPSVGNPSHSSNYNIENDENVRLEGEYKTQKEYEKTNKNVNHCINSKKSGNKDSFAIIDSILNDEDIEVNGVESLEKKNNSKKSKNILIKENEIPLFSEEERYKYDSVAMISEVETEKSAFILTPSKKTRQRDNAINIPKTRKIKSKHPTNMKK